MGRTQSPESRALPLIQPTLDAVGGRSYTQAIQTPGALGGRRGRETWHQPGPVPVTLDFIMQRPRVYGSPWRPIHFGGRVETQTSNPFNMECRVRMQAPIGPPFFGQIFDILSIHLKWAAGTFEGFGAVIIPGVTIPVGFIVYTELVNHSDSQAEDITLELDYTVRAVGQ